MESKAFTLEESQSIFLSSIKDLVNYWAKEKGSTDMKLNGLAFSILTLIDGEANLPHMNIVLYPDPDDKQYAIENNENYFESGMILNDDICLHELFSF